MTRTWMIELREARYPTLLLASQAAKCSPTLLRIIEEGSVTIPEIAKRIGKAYGMDKAQIKEITSEATVERRKREAAMDKEALRRRRLEGAYYG